MQKVECLNPFVALIATGKSLEKLMMPKVDG